MVAAAPAAGLPGEARQAPASGLSTLKEDQIAERGARLARREERAYWAYVSDEQRRQTGCPCTIYG